MLAMDVPPELAAHDAPVAIVQANGVDRTIGACAPIENSDAARGTAAQTLDPGLVARGYMRRVEKHEIDAVTKITVQKGPTHGALKDMGQGSWLYSPANGYFGADQATVMVEAGGLRIRIVFYLNVVPIVREAAEDGYEMFKDKEMCPQGKGEFWRIAP